MTQYDEETLPGPRIWLSLMEALTWVSAKQTMTLDELVQGLSDVRESTRERFRAPLQEAWHTLADYGSVGKLQIRGKRDGEQEERGLSVDDLRNCRHLTWVWDDPGCTSPLDLDVAGIRTVLRVQRYPDTFSGEWDRLEDISGFNYYDVVVLRSELLNLFPPSPALQRKFKSSAATRRRALQWLSKTLDELPPRSRGKKDLLNELCEQFEISQRQALAIWSTATEMKPEWSVPGRPRKNPSGEIISR